MDHLPTKVSIDWLTMTKGWQAGRPEETARAALTMLRMGHDLTDGVRPYPRSYNQAIGNKTVTASWHDEQPKMKVCINLTGHQCHEFFTTNGSLRPVIVDAWSDLMNFTRIDFAVDYFGPDASITELVEAIENDPDSTVARRLTPYRQIDIEAGQVRRFDSGVYIGSVKSDRYICVYDKALEQELEGQQWVRIELRSRKEKAQQFAEMAIRDEIGIVGRSLIREYCYPDVGWWRAALTGPVVEAPTIGRKQTDTVKWLIDVVAPVLASEMLMVDDWNDLLFQTYREIIDEARARLGFGHKRA